MVVTVKRLEEATFHSMKDEWNSLLAKSAVDNFFLRWEWIHTWWLVFGDLRTLCILTAHVDGRLAGIAPLYRVRSPEPPWPEVLRLCSDDLAPDYLDFIIEEGQESSVSTAFQSHLLNNKELWDIMILENLLSDSIVAGHWATPQWSFRTVTALRCPYIIIDDTFDDYLEKQNKVTNLSVRDLNRKERKLFRQENVTHVTIDDDSLLIKAVDDLFIMHRHRATQKGIKSNFTPGQVQRFHSQLVPILLKEKMLDLQFFYHEKTAISATYSFRYKNKLYMYQKGMDPQWSRRSVGTILQKMVIEQGFRDRLREIDLLKGEEPYKNSWANGFRQEVTLLVYNRTLRGIFLDRMAGVKSILKKLLRPSARGVAPPPSVSSAPLS